MFSPKQDSSYQTNSINRQKLPNPSPKYSQINERSISNEHLHRADQILSHEKSIVKENIDRLKTLLSEKKQFNRRQRDDLSPEITNKNFIKEKENVYTPQKGHSRNNTVNISSNLSRQSFGLSSEVQNSELITDIKKKIRGSPTRFNEIFAEGHFKKQMIQPDTVYIYTDNEIQINKYLGRLIEENQKLEQKIQQKDVQIGKKDQIIVELEEKLQEFVLAAQKKEEKIHSILFQKDGEIECLKLEKQQEIKRIKSEVENMKKTLLEQLTSFELIYQSKMQEFIKTVTKKVEKNRNQLQQANLIKLLRLKKQIRLQKSIFLPQQPYRKTKNILEMSPSIKGDCFTQLQQHRLNIQREMLQFEQEIKYQKNKYEEAISEYEEKYKQLEEKFFESQRKNEELKRDILLLKEEQAKFIQEYQKRLRKNQEIQRRYVMEQIWQSSAKSLSVQAPSKQLLLKKQLTPLKVRYGRFMTPSHKRAQQNSEAYLLESKKEGDMHWKSCLSMNLRSAENQADKNSIFDLISMIQKREYQVNMKEQEILKEKVELQFREKMFEMKKKEIKDQEYLMVSQRQMVLEQKEKEFEKRVMLKEQELTKRQAEIEEQLQSKQIYIQEMENVKKMVRMIEQAGCQPKKQPIEQSKILMIDTSQLPAHQHTKSPTSKKLKDISKVEYLAKKQRKEKQIVKTKLSSLERELMYERSKYAQLEELVIGTEMKLFTEIKQKAERKSSKNLELMSDSESVINDEESPFDTKLPILTQTPKSIEEEKRTAEWQNKVKVRLQDAISRLEELEIKCSAQKN